MIFFFAALAVGAVAACGDEAPGASVFGGPGPTTVPPSDAAPPPNVTEDDAGPEQCTGLTQAGNVVGETGYATEPPIPVGGDIADGTYVLTRLERYRFDGGAPPDPEEPSPFVGPTGASGRGTLVVLGRRFRLLSASGEGALPADTAVAWSGTASGTSLALREICPERGKTATRGYSVVGASIALFDGETRAVYLKQ